LKTSSWEKDHYDGDLMHKVSKNPEYLANIQLGFEHVVPHGLEHKRILVPLRTKTYKVCTIPRAFVANNVKKLWQIRLGVNPLSHNLHGTESYTVLTL